MINTHRRRLPLLPAALLLPLALAGASCADCSARKAPGPPPPPASRAPMVALPGGTYWLGAVDHDRKARACERPRHRVTVSPFALDRTEVTVAAYRLAVEAGVVPEPSCPARVPQERELCNWGKANRDDHPVNGVSWHAATAYCRWLGRRLPTEAELEYVLRGERHDAVFPWGNEEDPPHGWGNLVGMESEKRYPLWARLHGYRDPYIGTSPVGSFKPDQHGLYDVSGNVWEWCSDWFGEDYFAQQAARGAGPIRDPKGPPSGEHRVLKGGGFHCQPEELRIAERHHKPPADDSFFSGFRCAADALP